MGVGSRIVKRGMASLLKEGAEVAEEGKSGRRLEERLRAARAGEN